MLLAWHHVVLKEPGKTEVLILKDWNTSILWWILHIYLPLLRWTIQLLYLELTICYFSGHSLMTFSRWYFPNMMLMCHSVFLLPSLYQPLIYFPCSHENWKKKKKTDQIIISWPCSPQWNKHPLNHDFLQSFTDYWFCCYGDWKITGINGLD